MGSRSPRNSSSLLWPSWVMPFAISWLETSRVSRGKVLSATVNVGSSGLRKDRLAVGEFDDSRKDCIWLFVHVRIFHLDLLKLYRIIT